MEWTDNHSWTSAHLWLAGVTAKLIANASENEKYANEV